MTDINDITENRTLTIDELQEIFGFSAADILANREGRYSFGQHRLISTGIVLLAVAGVVILTLPFQSEAGRIFGVFGGMCFGILDLLGLMAGVSGLAAIWNTTLESRQTPLSTYVGYVTLRQNKDESWNLTSDAFTVPIEADAAEKFIEGEYKVYYVPKFVNDRDNLFSIEPV
jgi:hypothetical protein